MQNKLSFVDLLKETTELSREHRGPLTRGMSTRNIPQIIRRELIQLIPPGLHDFDLSDLEIMFIATLLAEPDSCRDIFKYFSRFWADSYEDALRVQLELQLSILSGPLKDFIEDDGSNRVRVRPEMAVAVISAMIGGRP